VPQAVARRREGYTHDVTVDGHTLVADEPEAAGGADRGPSPTRMLAAALASCTAITIEMYADRKGWDLGEVEVAVDMEYAQSGLPRTFLVTMKLPKELTDQQQQRLAVIGGRCPVHRVLSREAEVELEDRIELV
jgi:putative redox protein